MGLGLAVPGGLPAHVAEEYLVPGGFPQWLSQLFGIPYRPDRLPALLTIAAAGMATTLLAAGWARGWPLVCVATMVLLNGGLHAVASLLTLSYSPGLATGLLLWVPLGLLALRWCRGSVPEFALGVWSGIFAHGLVTLAAVLVLTSRGS